jgi:hypothetical protein
MTRKIETYNLCPCNQNSFPGKCKVSAVKESHCCDASCHYTRIAALRMRVLHSVYTRGGQLDQLKEPQFRRQQLVMWGGKFSIENFLVRKIFQKIFRFLKSSLNISFFNLFLVLHLLTAHSYCEIRTHATLKATQAQDHKKEVDKKY